MGMCGSLVRASDLVELPHSDSVHWPEHGFLQGVQAAMKDMSV